MKDEKKLVISGKLQTWLDYPTIWDGEYQIDILATIVQKFDYGSDIEITIVRKGE